MSIPTSEQQKQWYQTSFELFERTLNGESREPVHTLRRRALKGFLATGFPTTKNEEWRFTNVSPIAKTSFQPVLAYDPSGVTADHVKALSFDEHVSSRLVFIDGRFAQEFSEISTLPKGVVLKSLGAALKTHAELVQNFLGKNADLEENPFVALNTAFIRDGGFLYVPDGVRLDQPVQLIFLSSGRQEPFAVHPRNLIVLGSGSSAGVVETYVATGENVYLTNAMTEIVLGAGATLAPTIQKRKNGTEITQERRIVSGMWPFIV